jgi:hypothetical protein
MNRRVPFLSFARVLFYSFAVTACMSAVPRAAIGAEPADTTSSDRQSSTTLKGSVVEVSVTLNNLRDARLSISRVRKAAANLYDEVTRQQLTMNYNPNLVGTTVIMTPSPSFSGGFLPARKKWIVASMSEIGPIINLFKEDVDAAIESNRQTNVSTKTREALDELRTNAFESVNKSFGLYKELEGLTAGASYDNAAIATEVKSLDNQMKKLDQSLKKGTSLLQKEAKAAKKNQVAMRD